MPPIDPKTGLQRPDPTPARPDTPAIPRQDPGTNGYHELASKVRNDADAAAQTPYRERSGPPANPDVSPDAGGQNSRGSRGANGR
jgi:hypothetical protein